MKFGDRLRKLREGVGFGKGKGAEFARKVGVPPQHLHKWEKGRNMPCADNLSRLAEHLNVSERYLLYGEGPKTQTPPQSEAPPQKETYEIIDNVPVPRSWIPVLEALTERQARDLVLEAVLQLSSGPPEFRPALESLIALAKKSSVAHGETD